MWLEPLSLAGDLKITTSRNPNQAKAFQDWVDFLIWAGWWMRKEQVNGARLFMVLLLPTRICCSAICSLGALIGSIGKSHGALTWEQIISIPENTMVYTRIREGIGEKTKSVQVEGKLGALHKKAGKLSRELIVTSKKKRFKNSIFYIIENNPHCYPLTLTPQRKKFDEILTFFKIILPELKPDAILSIFNECLIVTNQTAWKRNIQGVLAVASQYELLFQASDLELLLMPSSKDEGSQLGVLISPQRPGKIIGENIPLAILDGPEALKSWDVLRSHNVIILIAQSEYDENSKGILANLTNVRDDSLLPMPESIPVQPPLGIEMMMFALESPEI